MGLAIQSVRVEQKQNGIALKRQIKRQFLPFHLAFYPIHLPLASTVALSLICTLLQTLMNLALISRQASFTRGFYGRDMWCRVFAGYATAWSYVAQSSSEQSLKAIGKSSFLKKF